MTADYGPFEREVIDRLARIETKADAQRAQLSSHTDLDERRFETLHRDLDGVRVDVGRLQGHREAAKHEGRKAGRRQGAGVAAAVVALAELAKLLLGWKTGAS